MVLLQRKNITGYGVHHNQQSMVMAKVTTMTQLHNTNAHSKVPGGFAAVHSLPCNQPQFGRLIRSQSLFPKGPA